MGKELLQYLCVAMPCRSSKNLLLLLSGIFLLNIATLRASANYSEHPAAEDIAKCRLTYDYRDIDKCLQTLGYKQVPWHYLAQRCGDYYKFEGRDGDVITVIELQRRCKESEAVSRRWEANCESKELYLYTSDGSRPFYGLLMQGATLNYACYVFRGTGKVVQP